MTVDSKAMGLKVGVLGNLKLVPNSVFLFSIVLVSIVCVKCTICHLSIKFEALIKLDYERIGKICFAH